MVVIKVKKILLVFVVKDPNNTICKNCEAKIIDGRPVEKDFIKYLPWFLEDIPGVDCTKGLEFYFSYFNAVVYHDN